MKLAYNLSNVKDAVHKWQHLEDDTVIDVMLAVYLINNVQSTDPLWMLFIAPPSSGKTELLRAFGNHPGAYFLSNLTPNTLISGKVQEIKDKHGNKIEKDVSLLPKLNGKTLIIKEFGTVLSLRPDQRAEILSQLREVYDGMYTKEFGTGKSIKWKGHIGVMAACTPVYDKHYGVISSLGDRFLLYRIENIAKRKMGIKAQKVVGQEIEMRDELESVFHNFINQFEEFEKPGGPEIEAAINTEIKEAILTLACFCAAARTTIERSPYDRDSIDYVPEPEGPPRLTKQFMQLAIGLAFVHGKDEVDQDIYEIVRKVGLDLLPKQRLRVINCLKSSEKGLSQVAISKHISLPRTTVRRRLEDLNMVGLAKEDDSGLWHLTKDAATMLQEIGGN